MAVVFCIVLLANNYIYAELIHRDIQSLKSEESVEEVKYLPLPVTKVEYIELEPDVTNEDIFNSYMELLTDDNMEDWFNGYKLLTNTLEDPPETIYDYFSEEELNYLFRCVECETRGSDFASKTHVASVIFNRLNTGKWGDTLTSVVTAPNQFSYANVSIPKDTIEACEFAFEIKDTAQGCLYFHSGQKSMTFSGANYVFSDSAVHHFYN